ncbi:NAD(P)/FAD-dependent oxidoreductase [Micromonospora sp. WMMD735]|uniref:NAD(P)/FAD-dependent oxidoreductase n=1 Tax=Micromonospora sp. WMMD735 TaxID=3404130 RepID=UPI003B95C4A5
MTTPHSTEKFDVAILGTHLACSVLATVLARHGLRVVLVDAPGPDEIAGETTVPYTAEVYFTLARRFDVPEIAGFGLTSLLPEHIRQTSGIKRSLGFLHHTAGREHDPRQAVQFNVPGEHAEWHPYRPHVDQHGLALARRYGAVLLPHRPSVADVTLGTDGVTLLLADGTHCRARCVVDGSGSASPLVRRLELDDPEPRLTMRSRVLAAHLTGVTPFEDCVDLTRYDTATAFSKGTVSHVFAGGWIQVAHFDNGTPHNPLAGVVASVDPVRFAELPNDPERAFRTLVARFPAIERCFTGATVSEGWQTGRPWQRTVSRTVGDRWLLFDRTASRNDLFLSRDLTMGGEMVHALAPVLIRAARHDDWSADSLRPVADFQERLIRFNDRLLSAARVATTDFGLWNAYSRVWLLWSMLSALSLKGTRNECLTGGSWEALERADTGPRSFAVPRGLPELLDSVFDLMDDVRRGDLAAVTATERIFGLLRRAPIVPPVYRFADPKARYYHFSLDKRIRMLVWSKTIAPAEFRRVITKENLTNVPPAAVR